MSLSRRSAAAAIVALAVALGGGLALASPEDPSPEGDVVLEPTGDGTEVGGGVEGLEGDGEEGVADPEAGDGEDEATADEAGSHGALVSEAAHEHAYDEACGNHGKYVSAIARTGEPPACATTEPAGDGDAVATDDGSSDAATATATTSDSGKTKAKAKTRSSRGRGRG